jgi:hypothetical protein
MPHYFFHLSFAGRRLPDEDGLELVNPAAAREEGLAVVRDLSNPAIEGQPKRWAGWFIEVTDAQGEQLLQLPIGHPALQVVPRDGVFVRSAPPAGRRAEWTAGENDRRPAPSAGSTMALVSQMLARRRRTAELLEANQRLREQLSSELLMGNKVKGLAQQLVVRARSFSSLGWQTAPNAIAPAPAPARPRLIVLTGGREDSESGKGY